MKKTKVKMNKLVYLGMSILDISETVMYEFWYDYIKPKNKDKAKLCYMDTESFVIYIFTEDFFEDINNDVERWFDTSNYDKNDKRPLIVFDDITADIFKNKKLKSIVTKLFLRGRKLNISLVFITQSYLMFQQMFISKIPNKRELQQIAINHSSDISTKDFANIYRKCTPEPYSFIVNDSALPSNNLLKFRKNIFDIYNKNHDN